MKKSVLTLPVVRRRFQMRKTESLMLSIMESVVIFLACIHNLPLHLLCALYSWHTHHRFRSSIIHILSKACHSYLHHILSSSTEYWLQHPLIYSRLHTFQISYLNSNHINLFNITSALLTLQNVHIVLRISHQTQRQERKGISSRAALLNIQSSLAAYSHTSQPLIWAAT